MQFVKMLKLILGGERAGRIARRTQMLIVLFTSGESFALVGLRTQWDKRIVAMWYSRFVLCPKSA